jgi:hypothetical protein
MRTTKTMIATTAAAALLAVAGCQHKAADASADRTPDERTLNTLMVKTAYDQNERNAIIAERTIYDHHFRPASAELNDLGLRQVRILADAYHDQAVRVSVARADASDDLYRRRLDAVRTAFADRGVDRSSLTLNDGQPGGSGIASEKVFRAYTAEINGTADSMNTSDPSAWSQPASSSSGRSSGGMSSGGTSNTRR